MDLTFVSTNAGKFGEVRRILTEYGVKVRWSRRALPEVQAERLETVVGAKLAAAEHIGDRVLVEDSGLFLPSLDGFPGVYSAYAFNTIGLEGVLRLLRGRGRRATFRTVAGLSIGARRWIRTGECRGRIADHPRGSHGFGYDPIFIPEGEQRTFGQLDLVEKNRRSHRAHAIHRIGRLLRTLDRE
ncbi:MAG: non-canonical purine NTP pyrophosphatase [Thermoplasmata archaeon]